MSDGISIAALVVSIVVAVFTWKAHPRPSFELTPHPLEPVEGQAWDSEWKFVLTNRGRGTATFVRVDHQYYGKTFSTAKNLTLTQDESWEMNYCFSRADVLDMTNPMRAKSSNRIVVTYRGNRDGKDITKNFYPPQPS